jgi:hypothetical protein
LLCSVNDAVNVLLVLPAPTFTVDPFSPALPLQDDASFPAAARLRIWRLGFESLAASIIAYRDARRVLRELGSRLGPGDSLDCVDNGGNDEPAT